MTLGMSLRVRAMMKTRCTRTIRSNSRHSHNEIWGAILPWMSDALYLARLTLSSPPLMDSLSP